MCNGDILSHSDKKVRKSGLLYQVWASTENNDRKTPHRTLACSWNSCFVFSNPGFESQPQDQ
jgi:hypothetical protein